MLKEAFFFIFSGLAILGALGVIISRKPTKALLCLLGSMISLAVIFTLMQAYFIAVVHLIVYAGAVLVLFLFVIMLQGLGATTPKISERFTPNYLAAIVIMGIVFIAFFIFCLLFTPLNTVGEVPGTVHHIGEILFTNYLLPFELIAVLLLLGIFASVVLAKEESKEEVEA